MSVFNILVIRLSSMGDILMPSALLAQIKKDYGPKVRLSYLTSEEFSYLVDGVSYIDEVITFRRRRESLSSLIIRLDKLHKQKPYDLILDLHSTMRSFLLRMRFCYIPRLSVDKRRFERFLLTKFKINLLKNSDGTPAKQLERLISDFKNYFHLNYDKEDLSYYLSNNLGADKALELSNCSYSFKELPLAEKWNHLFEGHKLISFFPSASFETKRWPIDSFKKLIRDLCLDEKFQEYKFSILAGPKDEFCKNFDELSSEFPDRVYNLYGQTNLDDSAAFAKRSELCIGNDTGLLHIAESVGTPVIMIYGPTTEYFGFSPHLKNSQYFAEKLWCRPCSTTGSKKCFRREQYCLTRVTPEKVKKSIEQVLGSGQ